MICSVCHLDIGAAHPEKGFHSPGCWLPTSAVCPSACDLGWIETRAADMDVAAPCQNCDGIGRVPEDDISLAFAKAGRF